MVFYTQRLDNQHTANLFLLDIDHTLSTLPAEQEQLIKLLVIDDVFPAAVRNWVWWSTTALQLASADDIGFVLGFRWPMVGSTSLPESSKDSEKETMSTSASCGWLASADVADSAANLSPVLLLLLVDSDAVPALVCVSVTTS